MRLFLFDQTLLLSQVTFFTLKKRNAGKSAFFFCSFFYKQCPLSPSNQYHKQLFPFFKVFVMPPKIQQQSSLLSFFGKKAPTTGSSKSSSNDNNSNDSNSGPKNRKKEELAVADNHKTDTVEKMDIDDENSEDDMPMSTKSVRRVIPPVGCRAILLIFIRTFSIIGTQP
ncbi:hypothetical protein BDF20DRAFT_142336 [Mycotypha africana]|uniref:uncharacterized protein n=1 Tax=Mycotypha africana TaxID=64632 RepID=UPI0022FFF6B4|nr:uncharacterized protein BDF20DRAFT_142336 [Mycotypha africana]KAI8969050.1 hypothetical protein BDF20DRAFT_142336 [Mycotypha africana]